MIKSLFNPITVKKDFPIFKDNPNLVYLDSGASSFRPNSVINAMNDYYRKYSSNIHRGLYPIAEKASYEYEKTRDTCAQFIGARSRDEIIFTRNATESLNLLAYCLEEQIGKNDEIVTSVVEHHANFVTWQQLVLKRGGTLKIIDIDEKGDLDIYNTEGNITLSKYINKKTKICALHYVSNVLGTVQPIKKIIKSVRSINPNVIIIIDAAQAVPHMQLSVGDLDCDFLVFSAHKMCGPCGVGVLWGRKKLLDNLPPFMFGGDMIDEVFKEYSTFNKVPHKFEAGTPDIAGVIGLNSAIFYLQSVGLPDIKKHEMEMVRYAMKSLHDCFQKNISILGENSRNERVGVLAFTLHETHPHDIAGMLGEEKICIRAGHHCAMPLHNRLSLNASSRACFYLYNTRDDVDKFVTSLKKVAKLLR